MKTWAIIRLQEEGFHRWKDAPESVVFLQNFHRHIFHIEVWISQKPGDREIEYIQTRWTIKRMVSSLIVQGTESCEEIAENLLTLLKEEFGPDRRYKVFIFEDNENGCCIE